MVECKSRFSSKPGKKHMVMDSSGKETKQKIM